MAGAIIRIDSDTLTHGIELLIERGENTYELLDELGAELATSTQDRFDSGTAPDGSNWPSSASANKRGGKTLVDSGDLVGSITHQPTKDYVDVGTNKVYAAIHQFGGKTGRGGATSIVERPFLGISDSDEKVIEDTVYEFLDVA